MRNPIAVCIFFAAILAAPAGCRKPAAAVYAPSVFVVPAAIPDDPLDEAWGQAPVHVATLLTQDLVERDR
ncbi:MAG: hypothetical protein N2439_07855 [Anaerolineae bacterium]|nr:hypothetical protein [Anaerolineae bacterium]